MTTPPEMVPAWLHRYREEYLTLEQVGEIAGITREAFGSACGDWGITYIAMRLTSFASGVILPCWAKIFGKSSFRLGVLAKRPGSWAQHRICRASG